MSVCEHPDLISLESALTILLADVRTVNEARLISLMDADGTTLAQPMLSPVAHPPADNSAMDGYAIRHQDLAETRWFRVSERILAGDVVTRELEPGCCARIMTGAALPPGADTVIMQEQASFNDAGWVEFSVQPDKQDNVRLRGEEIQQGDPVFEPGRRLRPADIGLLASLGISTVSVVRPLKVGLIATGNELCMPGEPLPDGHIYESNRYTLMTMLKRLGCEVLDLGIVPDDREDIRVAFQYADQQCDLVMTSGGVSVGEADYCREVLEELGSIDLWRLAIKPGKPFAFGHLTDSSYVGLPGNPVSAMVTFHQLVVPLIKAMMGEQPQPSPVFRAILDAPVRKRPGRMDFQRGWAYTNESGEIRVKPHPRQGSSLLTTVSDSNAYLLLSRESGHQDAGTEVWVLLFDRLLS